VMVHSQVSVREYIDQLKADKIFFQELLKTSLVSMSDKLTKLVKEKINSDESQKNTRRPPGAQGGRRFQE
jgi:hypothetical protein